MANHGYVTTRKHLLADLINLDLMEINERVFKNKLTLTRDATNYWTFEYPNPPDGRYYSFPVQLTNKNKLEFRHQMGDWNFWAQNQVAEELALKYNGLISDDGVSEKWKAENKTPHYKDWVKRSWYRMAPKPVAFAMTKLQLKSVPKELRDL